MRSTRNARLRNTARVAVIGLAATIVVVVTSGWIRAIPVIVVMAGGALFNFWLGGRDSDAGYIAGGRADERQAAIRRRQRAIGGMAMLASCVVGTVIAAALRAPAAPFELLAVVGFAGYAAGLVMYGRTVRGSLDDMRALIGAQADERQAAVRIRSAQLAGLAMLVVAIPGDLITQGVHYGWLFSLPVVVYVAAGMAELRRQRVATPGRV
jgi:hypothetical protein